MSRLQDFQTVTPTSSDNILIVQSQGQGLASVGSTLGAKMDKANPTGTGTLTMSGDIIINGSTSLTSELAQRTQYRSYDKSSLATGVNDKASWDSVWSDLPNSFYGVVRILFKGGYHIVGIVVKSSGTYGSILGSTNDNVAPYHYIVAGSTSYLKRLAYV